MNAVSQVSKISVVKAHDATNTEPAPSRMEHFGEWARWALAAGAPLLIAGAVAVLFAGCCGSLAEVHGRRSLLVETTQRKPDDCLIETTVDGRLVQRITFAGVCPVVYSPGEDE